METLLIVLMESEIGKICKNRYGHYDCILKIIYTYLNKDKTIMKM